LSHVTDCLSLHCILQDHYNGSLNFAVCAVV